MIRQLGIQKILIITTLAVALVVIYFYGIRTLGPRTQSVEKTLLAEQSEFNQTFNNLESLRNGIAKFEVQKDKFTNLQTLGFFDPQNRVDITRRLNEMQKESGLVSAQYSISPASTEKNQKAEDAGYKVLYTNIDFNLEAILDEEIYKFIYLLNYGFQGHVTIESLEIVKGKEITPSLLQQIGSGDVTSVINAKLKTTLRTLVVDADAQAQNEQGVY